MSLATTYQLNLQAGNECVLDSQAASTVQFVCGSYVSVVMSSVALATFNGVGAQVGGVMSATGIASLNVISGALTMATLTVFSTSALNVRSNIEDGSFRPLFRPRRR